MKQSEIIQLAQQAEERKERRRLQKQKEERLKLEQENILFGPEEFILLKSEERKLEELELLGGPGHKLTTIDGLIQNKPGEYMPMFPNDNKFFPLMYQLKKWTHLDPQHYIKPPIVAKHIKQLIYGRFIPEVLPSLLKKDNPIIHLGYI